MSKKVRFFYMTDPKNPGRVVTVARRFVPEDGDAVEFAFSVSNPGGFRGGDTSKPYKGDNHEKKKGRMIATARLESHPFVVDLDGLRPLTAICDTLSSLGASQDAALDWAEHFEEVHPDKELVPRCVRRIAAHYLEQFHLRAAVESVD